MARFFHPGAMSKSKLMSWVNPSPRWLSELASPFAYVTGSTARDSHLRPNSNTRTPAHAQRGAGSTSPRAHSPLIAGGMHRSGGRSVSATGSSSLFSSPCTWSATTMIATSLLTILLTFSLAHFKGSVFFNMPAASTSSTSTVQASSSSTPSASSPAPAPSQPPAATLTPPPLRYFKIKATYPHDQAAFTQGLIVGKQGQILESTGLYGHSQLRRVDLASGAVKASVSLPKAHFGEGLAVTESDGLAYVLTWKEGAVHVFDSETLEHFGHIPMPQGIAEGWGLCVDDTSGDLIMSDGSSKLYWLRVEKDTSAGPSSRAMPKALRVVKSIEVTSVVRKASSAPSVSISATSSALSSERQGAGGGGGAEGSEGFVREPVPRLNELEWVRGRVYANVWYQDEVLVIDPATGYVEEKLAFPSADALKRGNIHAVLNGIAYDKASDALYVTGKLWPALFHVER